MLISYRDKKREDANRIITTTDFDYRNPCSNVSYATRRTRVSMMRVRGVGLLILAVPSLEYKTLRQIQRFAFPRYESAMILSNATRMI